MQAPFRGPRKRPESRRPRDVAMGEASPVPAPRTPASNRLQSPAATERSSPRPTVPARARHTILPTPAPPVTWKDNTLPRSGKSIRLGHAMKRLTWSPLLTEFAASVEKALCQLKPLGRAKPINANPFLNREVLECWGVATHPQYT